MDFPVLFIFLTLRSWEGGGRVVVRLLMTSGLPWVLSFLLYRLSRKEDRMCGGRMGWDASVASFPQNVL